MVAGNKQDESTALVVPTSTDILEHDFGDEAGEGVDAKLSDFLLPMISLLAPLSPQVASREKKVPGAVGGMFHDSSTDDLYDGEKGLLFVPALRQERFVEWMPRKARQDGSTGQLVDGRNKGATWDVNRAVPRKDEEGNPVLKDDGTPVLDYPERDFIAGLRTAAKLAGRKSWELRHPTTDNDVVDTVYLYGIIVTSIVPVVYVPAVLAISKTKLKMWRRFFGKLARYKLRTGKPPPFYYHQIRITSWEDENMAKEPFWNLAFAPAAGTFADSLLPVEHELISVLKDLRDNVIAGLWNMDESAEVSQSAGDAADADIGTPEEDGERNDLF